MNARNLLATALITIAIISLQVNGWEKGADCEVPKEFPHGRLRPVSRAYRGRSTVPTGIELQFNCDKGYKLNGALRVICSNGTWKPDLPTCDRNETECRGCCELPSNFTNGKVVPLEEELRGHSLVIDNGMLRFSCNSGYALLGENLSLCLEGSWLPEIPICIRNSCPKPPPVEHGRIAADIGKEVFPLGANISYECDDDYELVKTASVVCTGNFSWEGEIPECKEKVKCEDPGTGLKALREGKCCEVGDILSYSCIEEYEIAGPSAITCTADGTWNSTRPRCQPGLFCDVPDKIPHGKIYTVKNGNKSIPDDEEFFFPDDEIMIICDKGYTVGNQSDYLFCQPDGQWDEAIPACAPAFHCNIPDPPENGYILELEKNGNLSIVPYDFEINFACHPGYRGIGNGWRRCGEYGWTTSNPRCEEIQCPDPGQIENGWTQGTDFRIGNATYYGCFSGYSLLGSHKRVCLENGQWGGELPRCNKEDNYCPNPGIPIGGTKTGSRYDLGSVVHFQCNPGSMLIGSANRTCQRNREWSGEQAKCFGQNDFDDKRAVGSRIKNFLHEADVVQEVSRGRSIDLNFPGRLIFVFIFDVSGSVGEQDFNRSIAFAKAIVKAVKMDTSGARVGAITFSSKASIEINPVELENEKDVLEQLDKIEYKKGGTATSSALVLLKEQMMPLTTENYGRDCKFITFLLTDGKANMAGNPVNDAKVLKDNQVEIFCIGITGDRRMGTLREIASTKEKHVFILDSYESLNWLVDDIIKDEVDYSKCGVRRSTVAEFEEEDERGRVIKGKKVVKNWPWMAIVFTVDPLNPDTTKSLSVCGAALISNKWLLTAAHCMLSKEKGWKTKEELIVHLGVTDLRNATNLKKHSIAGYIVHPLYSKATYDYDIAVMELLPPATYNEFIRPICLPPSANDINTDPSFYRPGQKAAVVGWGYDRPLADGERPKYSYSQVARRVVVPLQKRGTCSDGLKKEKNHVFTDQMICAGGEGKDACSGDSGGPLMRKLTNDIGEDYWTAIGIVSWGVGCGQPNTYGFYTKVSVFTEWIDEVTKGDYCQKENADNADVCHY